ncbi:hypothetical protein MA16_Dca016238 [Dendrobium catenatum]|uniref:Uncharacterized protein n=1 Tax=Dendrobium catenatum TaxID=906689 RepID=A0A2I0VVS4_9ASPA|nr:hypothetical protein MA16_Dca016238 [Dendrobium catenatum]
MDRLDDVDFLAVTWILSSPPTSASACKKSRPASREMTSKSTQNETIEAAVSGNLSAIRI